jgi:molecular chaperone GrpE
MEKDQNINDESYDNEAKITNPEDQGDGIENDNSENINDIKEITPEDKVLELEDKLARAFAEMENQRRRFEKEREDAFNYGGFAFAKETLNLIDNLERSKQILAND